MFFNGNRELKDLLDGDWKTRQKILEEELGRTFDGNYHG